MDLTFKDQHKCTNWEARLIGTEPRVSRLDLQSSSC